MTPMFSFLQQQKQQQQQQQNDTDNSVESAMYAYLHDQTSSSPDSPVPTSSTNSVSTSSPKSTCWSQFTDEHDLLDTTNSIFQSPQLRNHDHDPMLTDPETSFHYLPPTNSTQQQQQQPLAPSSVTSGLFGYSLHDSVVETANMDDSLYSSSSNSNSKVTTMDPSFMELLNNITINDIHHDTTNPTLLSTKQEFNMQVNSFTDLIQAIDQIKLQVKESDTIDSSCLQLQRPYKKSKRQHTKPSHQSTFSSILTRQQQQQQKVAKKLPKVVKDTVDMFLPTLMEKAQSHWCCVGFKVAPVTLSMIQNWRQAPVTIVYCVASIALVTFLDHNANQAYVKTAAIEFYQQARRKMDDIVFDDENDTSNYNKNDSDDENDGAPTEGQKVITIQSYFCLSYTSNLLRLYEQQRTWGGLASIALQLRTKDIESGYRPMDQPSLLCYCRWYYVDAWMSLTLDRDCLLPDTPPQFILDAMQSSPPPPPQQQQQQLTSSSIPETMIYPTSPHEHQSLYQFAMLTKFMRRYIQVIQAGKLLDPITKKPSSYYYQITTELKQWYDTTQQENNNYTMDGGGKNGTDAHLHLCYHAMRLVILYKLLHPELAAPPDDWTLMDGLDTNLALLSALQRLASQGCDQSTYSYMFYAIHNTASRIYQHHTKHRDSKWQKWAKHQLQMNLVLLKGTQAYVNDVFQIRVYAEKIEQQFLHHGLQLSACYRSILSSMEQQQLQLEQQRTKHMNDNEDDGQQQQQQQQQQHDNSMVPRKTTTKTQSTMSKSDQNASSATDLLPGMYIYKLHTTASIKKPRKSTKTKQTKQTKQ